MKLHIKSMLPCVSCMQLLVVLPLLALATVGCSGSNSGSSASDVPDASVPDAATADSVPDSVLPQDTADQEALVESDQMQPQDLATQDLDALEDQPDTAPPQPTLIPEAGFVEIEPVDYVIRNAGRVKQFTSSEARIWYAFQPADEAPETKPLAIFFNGGPGCSSSLLFGFNTGLLTVDPRLTGGLPRVPNPTSWTRFANLLYIDARETGFSYNLMDNVQNKSYRNKEFSARNYNPLFDAADFLRVVLRFLAKHPEIQANPVLVVGESYGGVRGTVMGYLLLNYSEMAEETFIYEDQTLSQEIQTHFETIWPDYAGVRVPRETIATQFGHLAFIQPLLSGGYQSEVAGEMFEQPDSVIQKLAQETGTQFVTCAEAGSQYSCDAEYNAQMFVDETAARDLYNVTQPKGWIDDISLVIDEQLDQIDALAELLGTDPTQIPQMYPSSRKRGYRYGDLPSDDLLLSYDPASAAFDASFQKAISDLFVPYPLRLMAQRRQSLLHTLADTVLPGLQAAFGQLYEWDYHYVASQYPITATFYMYESLIMKIDPSSDIYGEMFLYDIMYQKAFITRAANDIVIYAPAIPPALCKHTALVSACDVVDEGDGERPGLIRFAFQPDAFDGVTAPQQVEVRFPPYATSGHPVEASQPEEFLDDVESWYHSEGEHGTTP